MKKERIIKKLFRSYSILFLLFYLLSITVAVIYIANEININIIDTQKRMLQAINNSIELYFKDMNDFSMELLNSGVFKQAVIIDLPEADKSGSDQTQPLKRIYEESYKMFERGYRVGIATNSSYYIWLGDNIIVQSMDIMPETYKDYTGFGKAEVRKFEQNQYLALMPDNKQKTVTNESTICLARSINTQNFFAQPQAMLEIHVSANDFNNFINELCSDVGLESMSISIFGSDNSVLYGNGIPSDFLLNSPTDSYKIKGNIIQKESVLNNEISVLYTIPSSVYYQKLNRFIIASFIFSVVMGIIIMIVTYRLSFSLSKPLKDMSNQLEKIRLDNNLSIEKVQTEIYELDVMAQTVFDLNAKLISSLDNIVTLKTASLQSQLMALQSQIQPHFLHNTLAVIGTLSEQGNSNATARMCNNLSQMLRYVSFKEDTGVTVYEEVKVLNCYTEIMRERFKRAEVHLNIPFEMMQIKVPKLILQPLVENSFKYSKRNNTEIFVTGITKENMWQITVRDNGEGFLPQKADEILQHCQEIIRRQETLSAKIDGMGLVNIYTRLALYYANDFIFEIQPNGGITIGGRINLDFNK